MYSLTTSKKTDFIIADNCIGKSSLGIFVYCRLFFFRDPAVYLSMYGQMILSARYIWFLLPCITISIFGGVAGVYIHSFMN
jgi:hypothetical protein